MTKKKVVVQEKCPVCGCKCKVYLWKRKAWKNSPGLVSCRKCGHIYNERRMYF